MQIQQFGGHVNAGADAAGRVIEFAGLRLGERDQLLHRLGGDARMHQQHIGRRGYQRERGEILQGVVGRGAIQGRQYHQRPGKSEQQGVAVSSRLGHDLAGNEARRAGTAVGDDLLAEQFAHARREYARAQIGEAARCAGHDHANGFVGVGGLRRRERTERNARSTSSAQ